MGQVTREVPAMLCYHAAQILSAQLGRLVMMCDVAAECLKTGSQHSHDTMHQEKIQYTTHLHRLIGSYKYLKATWLSLIAYLGGIHCAYFPCWGAEEGVSVHIFV